jgi:hypothetical protein
VIYGSDVDERWTVQVYLHRDPVTDRARSLTTTIRGTREDALALDAELKRAAAAWRKTLGVRPGRTDCRPFDLASLRAAVGPLPADELARAIGVSRRHLYRLRDIGLTDEQADQAATAFGRHPVEVWPAWFDDLT